MSEEPKPWTDLLKIEVSDAARARVEADFGYLPVEAKEVAGGYLTLIERGAAQYSPYSESPADFAAATSIMQRRGDLDWSPETIARQRREYLQAVEPLMLAFARFLALYPRPIIISPKEP